MPRLEWLVGPAAQSATDGLRLDALRWQVQYRLLIPSVFASRTQACAETATDSGAIGCQAFLEHTKEMQQ